MASRCRRPESSEGLDSGVGVQGSDSRSVGEQASAPRAGRYSPRRAAFVASFVVGSVGYKAHYGSRSKRETGVGALFYSLIDSAKLPRGRASGLPR